MLGNKKFQGLVKPFWAHIKLLSETLGYSERSTGNLKTYHKQDIINCLQKLGLATKHLDAPLQNRQYSLETIIAYLNWRAKVLNEQIKPDLMNREEAKKEFEKLVSKFKPKCKLPMNKQKGEKKHYAYLTCIVNILTERELGGCFFVQDPQKLVAIILNHKPIRTFSRRFDGVFPTIVNPKAVWEVKEYYGTTTFGSRVADGIYESQLDGEEILELKQSENIHVKHYLVIDDYFNWWVKGKSFLCRLIDMLHMNYVDEIIFGREVLTRWPEIVKSWKG